MIYNTWNVNAKGKDFVIHEVDFDYDVHRFEISLDGKTLWNIEPPTIEEMNNIIESLNNGANPLLEGWEDGNGNTIHA